MGFGTVGAIDIRVIIELCDLYGAYLEDFEKVLMIENIIYPRMVEKAKKTSSKESK